MIDIGCGNGRQTNIFAKLGYDVCGIDISEKFLLEAEKNAKAYNVQVKYINVKASDLTDEAVYDFALAFHHSIGFMSDKELNEHFRKIYKCLKPNGIFLFEMAGPKLHGAHLKRVKDWKETEKTFILVDKQIIDGFRNEICIIIDKETGEIKEYREHQRAFSLSAVKKILKKSGFNNMICYADLTGTAATNSNFGLFICQKGSL